MIIRVRGGDQSIRERKKKKWHLFLALLATFRQVTSNKRKTILKMDDCFSEIFCSEHRCSMFFISSFVGIQTLLGDVRICHLKKCDGMHGQMHNTTGASSHTTILCLFGHDRNDC